MHSIKLSNNTVIISETDFKDTQNVFLQYCKKIYTILVKPIPEWRILAAVSIIQWTEKNLWKILLLERKPEDRTCAWLYTLPGWKIEHQDIVLWNIMGTIFRWSHRETREETWLYLSWSQKLIGHYDNDRNETKKFRIFVTKSPGYKGNIKKFPTKEHNKMLWLTPEEIIHEPKVWPITTKIIKEYYGL